jgi:hypothetical protein
MPHLLKRFMYLPTFIDVLSLEVIIAAQCVLHQKYFSITGVGGHLQKEFDTETKYTYSDARNNDVIFVSDL